MRPMPMGTGKNVSFIENGGEQADRWKRIISLADDAFFLDFGKAPVNYKDQVGPASLYHPLSPPGRNSG